MTDATQTTSRYTASDRANLVHPLTDDSVDDHSRYALWLGNPVPLKLETLRRTYRPELLPTT